MTLTTLEVTPIEDLDFAVPCDGDECSAAAEFIIETFCCPRLNCERCTTSLKALVAGCIGWSAYCFRHPDVKIRITRISDFILSIDKL